MALVRKSSGKKKSLILLVVFFVILIAGGAYLYSLSITEGPGPITDLTIRQLQSTLNGLRSTDQKLQPDLEQLLSDVRYKELQSYGTFPIDVGEMGRPNPFSHF